MTNPPFLDSSWQDPNGRILDRAESGYVLRAVNQVSLQTFKNLQETKALEKLFALGFVETELTNIQVDQFAGVLKHKQLPFISLPNEWTMLMLRDAGIVLLRLALYLEELGYTFNDGHPWNLSLAQGRMIYYDWGSIIPKEQSTHNWLMEFRKHFVIPLWIYKIGFRDIAYESLLERRGGILKSIFNKRYLRLLPVSFSLTAKRCARPDIKTLVKLLRWMESLQPASFHGKWSNYDQTTYAYKDIAFREFLGFLPGDSSIFDLGCNKGAYSLVAHEAGHPVVAIDSDVMAIDHLYQITKEKKLNICPLHVDFMRPTPGYGPDLAAPSIFERLQCDYGIGLAISHHLARLYAVPFDMFARVLHLYSRKGVLVEYIDPSDYHLQGWQNKGWKPPEWYTEAGFIEAFSQYYSLRRVWKTEPTDRNVRKVFFFES